ncbi:MAG: ABC transporter substrate-binding protein [Planctomycetes bacterium]|nr:ABC transporter substrate-binding protein [Planctomycetota bacterium]
MRLKSLFAKVGVWVALGAIGLGGGSAVGQDKAPILIGHYGSLTGSEATFGQSTSNGIRLAIKELNAAGGLNGRLIELKEYDTKGDPKEATNSVTRLVASDKVSAVLGEVASGLSLAGGPVCQENGIPMISPSSTNPRVTMVGDMIFRVCFIDPFQGQVCAKFARENLKLTKAALFYDQKAPYSDGLAKEFRKAFEKLGGKITAEEKYTGGDQNFKAQLTKIRGTGPEVIFIPGYYTDVGNIALQARELDLKVPLLGGDGWDSEQLGKIAKQAIVGSYYSNHYAPDQDDARVKEFIAKYKADYNGATPDGLAALGYDAAKILFDAMKRAKSLGGKDLRDAIAGTKDFPGVTGSITIDSKRNAVKSAVVVEMTGDPPTPKYRATVAP